MKYVKRKAELFVKKHVRTNNERELNKYLYTEYGHTFLGLQHIVRHKISLPEYNNFVYGDPNHFEHLKLTSEEIIDLNFFIDHMKECGVRVEFLSNAPSSWVKHFVGNDKNLVFQQFLESNKYNILKPESNIYELVNIYHPYIRKIIIDDKLKNLTHDYAYNWNKIWITAQPKILEDSNICHFETIGNEDIILHIKMLL